MIANQSRDQADNAGKKVIADRLSGQELRPSWLIQWTFVGLGPNILSGLDPDPKLAAYAPSELILESASVRPIDARIRFLKAATALKSAFDSLSSENENAIHAVIKEFPWILVREPEYTEFMSAPRLRYVEKIQVDDKNLISKTREVIPDFIYKLSDGSVLCVEIESYSKRLHTMQTETSFHVNSAQSNRAFFQIENYKSIIDVDGHSDICTQLGVPTVTTFRYLIVVGSRLQTGFDERSWEHQKRRKLQMGIEIQNWDYYLDLLYRTYEACGANRVTA